MITLNVMLPFAFEIIALFTFSGLPVRKGCVSLGAEIVENCCCKRNSAAPWQTFPYALIPAAVFSLPT